jgi:L-asparaginase / beta-aspartyl-peptidase
MSSVPRKYAIAVHGGAGVYNVESLSAQERTHFKNGIVEALRAGDAILSKGGSALDGAEAAVMVLENNSLFNAGRGAVLTSDGIAELDAAIMDGATLNTGAVTRSTTTKNPIQLARAIMDHSEYVMLSAEGADLFAAVLGLEQVSNDYFILPERKEQLAQVQSSNEMARLWKLGTVGAVVKDRQGNLAAATSTGGMTNKKWGRIGDSSIIGCGTYADANCAISTTGWGEYFIRTTFARSIAALIEHKNMPIAVAAKMLLTKVATMGGDGGVIVIDKHGAIALEYNTPGMFRGSLIEGAEPSAFIQAKD